MKIAATAPEFPGRDLAQSLMPNGSDARLRRQRALQRAAGRPPLRDRKEQLEQHAVPRRRCARLLRAAGTDPEANITELAQRSTSPAARMTANRWRSSRKNELPNHSRLLHRPVRAARPGADGERLERRPVPGRRNGQVLQQGPRRPSEPADPAVRPGLRAQPALGARSRRPTPPSSRPRRTPGSTTTSRATAANRRRRRRGHPHAKCPVNTAGTHYHASSWARWRPASCGSTAPGRRRSSPRARRRATSSSRATSAGPRRAPTTRRRRPTRSRRPPRPTRSPARRRSWPR